MSTARCQEVQITTCPATAACWQDEGAEIRSLVSRRVFQIQVDAEGVVRCLCRENDNVREVLVADVIGDARDSASLLRTQARDEAYARVRSLPRRGVWGASWRQFDLAWPGLSAFQPRLSCRGDRGKQHFDLAALEQQDAEVASSA